MKLQHEQPNEAASQISVQYDGRVKNLELDENGTVEVDNKAEKEALLENYSDFFEINDDEEPDHVLSDKTVDEVQEYVRDIEDVDRLKELRELEDRKTGKEAVDERIQEVREHGDQEDGEGSVEKDDHNKENQEEEDDDGEVENQDESTEENEEDGAETED